MIQGANLSVAQKKPNKVFVKFAGVQGFPVLNTETRLLEKQEFETVAHCLLRRLAGSCALRTAVRYEQSAVSRQLLACFLPQRL